MTMLSPELTVAWALLGVWALLQFAWYRRVRVEPAPPPPRRSDSSQRTPAATPKVIPALPTGGSPEFLAELGLDDAAPAAPRSTAGSVYR